MSDVTLTLDGFVFQDFEIPESLPFGGSQALSIKRLIGGARIIDAMGADERPIEWSGRFRGSDAVSRAQEIDGKRKAGKAISLTWGDLSFTVVIARFEPTYEKAYEVPYSISCEVIPDSTVASDLSVDQMIGSDNGLAQSLGAGIGDGALSGHLTSLDSAISTVSSFAKATQAQIASVLAPIAAVQGQVSTLLASAQNTLLSVTSVGGVLPGLPIPGMVAGLISQVSAMGRSADLLSLSSVAGRMATNLSAIGQGGAQVVVAGGDLYHIAAAAYGDASAWATIAKANGLTDPLLTGVQTILIPPSAGDTAGILA